MTENTHEQWDDNTLLKSVGQKQDKKAFHVLCERYERPIYNMALRMGLCTQDAEDATQNLLIKLWQKADKWDLKKGASAKTWIYHIGYNVIIDQHRKQKRFFGLVSNTPIEETHVIDKTVKASYADKDMVKKGLKNIPERQRSALILFYYQGLSTKEIAQIQNTTPKAIERLLSRARDNFKQYIQKLEVQHATAHR